MTRADETVVAARPPAHHRGPRLPWPGPQGRAAPVRRARRHPGPPRSLRRGPARPRPPPGGLQQRHRHPAGRPAARLGRRRDPAPAACSTPSSRTSTACCATSTPSSCTTCGSRSAAPGRPSSCSATCSRTAWPRQYAPEFKWLGDLTTPTRDLDVHLLGFGSMAGQLAAASPADLEPLRAFLVRRRAPGVPAAGRRAALAPLPRPDRGLAQGAGRGPGRPRPAPRRRPGS